MNRKQLAKQAFNECCSAENIIHRGRNGRTPYWNTGSMQFMYVPAFGFGGIPSCSRYRYDAVDEAGVCHSFESGDCEADLSPIWAELPEGVVRLTVTALHPDGSAYAPVGARTFFKLASFPEKTPEAVSAYRDCAARAYEYAMKQPFVRYWLEHGVPDPAYDLNTYPSKIISALVDALITYSRYAPEARETAMKIAVTAADWMIGITPRGDHPLADLPPTYYFDFCPDPDKYGIKTANYAQAIKYKGTLMMIYPASAGSMYLHLAEATGNAKYAEEALKIGQFYLDHVEDNGSWYLVRSEKTGEPTAPNYVAPAETVLPFLSELYDYTKDEKWKKLSEGAVAYIEKNQLIPFDWEGQFEDIGVSARYENLSQYGPVGLAQYYLKFHRGEPEYVEKAKELIRFAEDQFVIWNRISPWFFPVGGMIESYGAAPEVHTPAALEQYRCYWPIDASVCHVTKAFLALYEAGCGDIWLAKAKVMADQITRMQFEDGQIPTFWIARPDFISNFWFNCMFSSCRTLMAVAEYDNIQFE